MTTAPLAAAERKLREVDLGLVTVLALAWFVATVASSLTLWLLVGVLAG